MRRKNWLLLTTAMCLGACSLNPKPQVNPTSAGLNAVTVVSTSTEVENPATPSSTGIADLTSPTAEQAIPPVITAIVTATTPAETSPTQQAYTGLIALPTTYRFTDGQYLDDRGSEYMFMISYFNAIRQNLLPMAYSYWNDNPDEAGSFDSFVQTYSEIKADELTIVKYGTSGAAGSIYATMGVTLKGTKFGLPTAWAGCYTLRTPNPSLFDSADYHNRHFSIGRINEMPSYQTPADALEVVCSGMDFGLMESVIPGPDGLGALDAKHFVDSRSTPEGLISSFWNALNRQEYARAYSYFEAPAIFPGPYITFKNGYLDTSNVSGAITPPEKLAAAGNWYWKVPVVLRAETRNGIQQAFVGCYVVHQSGPALYVSPPFNPMGIQKARFEAVSLTMDKEVLQKALGTACDNLP